MSRDFGFVFAREFRLINPVLCMSATGEQTLHFRAMTFGVDRTYDAVTVGFEMDRRPGHDSRGLMVSRATPESGESDESVYVEYGEPQQYCMEGGIERVQSAPGRFRIQFTEEGAKKMAGIWAIEVDYDEVGKDVPDMLKALDYIFEDFLGHNVNTEL